MMKEIRAIITDDESHCRSSLSKQLEWYCPQVKVVGLASNIQEARAHIEDLKPDLVFLDIQMPGGTGFDLLEELPSIDFHVIFTTAYDDYALQAFQVNALSYLLKPIGKEDLIKAIEKIPDAQDDAIQNKLLRIVDQLQSEKTPLSKIALPVRDGLEFVELDKIVRCESDGSYTYVYLANEKKIYLSKTLKFVHELINHKKFVRVHHSHLINMDYVTKYVRGTGGYIVLEDGQSIPVSRAKKDSFLDQWDY